MSKHITNELAINIEKINYLFKSVKKSKDNPQKLELALMKKYVEELYEGLLQLENPGAYPPATADELGPEVPEINLPPIPPQFVPRQTEAPEPTPEPKPEYTPPPPPEREPEPEPEPEKPSFLEKLKEKVEDTAENLDNAVKTQVLDKFISKPAAEEDDDGEETDWAVTTRQEMPTPVPPSAKDDSSEDETVAMELNDILAKQRPKPDANAGGKKIDINFNQRHAFVNELFNGNAAAFDKAIADLNQKNGYIEALTYVNLNLRHDFGWNDNDATVKDFLEVIKRSFL